MPLDQLRKESVRTYCARIERENRYHDHVFMERIKQGDESEVPEVSRAAERLRREHRILEE